MIVWGLFDSGNGTYKQVAEKMGGIELYSIGIDRENKNDHFINLNLADYSYIFGNNELWETLDTLPKPDLIIASPPCESWSNASAMFDGNACWKEVKTSNLFGEMKSGTKFTIRDFEDYKKYQHFPERQRLTRINGELTIHNTIEIIKRYEPKFHIIENPAFGRIWEYIEKIIGFDLMCENITTYSDYGYPLMKPTRFSGNINLGLSYKRTKTEITMNDFGGYNNRSNIPHNLVEDIFNTVKENL